MELNYNSAAALRAFLDQEGLAMRKKYGQNFLINPGVRQALVDALESPDLSGDEAAVWEIGPGLGAMTRLLLDRGFAVRAFEIDSGFAGALRKLFADTPAFTLVEGDAMQTWPSQAAAPYLLGNLPYNIAAPLLADFIEQGRFFNRMVVTVQREVARRMAARPGSADYSSFSILCGLAYTVKPLMVIRPASFYPRPHVDSQGVLLERRADKTAWPPVLFPLLRRLFSSRRKMIKNNLSVLLAGHTAEVLSASGIKGEERAENLGVEECIALAKTIEDMRILTERDVNSR